MENVTPDSTRMIANVLGLRESQVWTVVRLLDEGNTIPFIARYRKEMTGELDENQLREIAARNEFERSLQQRKSDVLRLLEEQGVFSDATTRDRLVSAIEAARSLTDMEDIYRPYRPKRKTRASVAKERGLEPLLSWLLEPARVDDDESRVRAYIGQFVTGLSEAVSVDEALQGAADIFAEQVSDDAKTRRWVREVTFSKGSVHSIAVDADADSVYASYYDFQEPVAKAQPHRILAMNRGARDGYLRVSIAAPQVEVLDFLRHRHVPPYFSVAERQPFVAVILGAAVVDAYKRLIAPSMERDVLSELSGSAESHAIQIFGQNLKNLLLQPPITGKFVLGVDPAYRTGCKLAVVDPTGKLMEVAVIYPNAPQNKVVDAERVTLRLLSQFGVGLVAIGNGTASRETESFIADCLRHHRDETGQQIPYLIVSEAGASVYSASVLAGEEFPDLDVSERSAISIARRIQDPLAELVKIDPKSVGVGQYQHDVSPQKLGEKLGAVVESAVNHVGVDVNTASPNLLSYVAGLNRTVAKNIVEFREQNGRFPTRKCLSKVPRLGKKTLEQCVGFLRIVDGDEVLDSTPIHPESYGVVDELLRRTHANKQALRNPDHRREWIQALSREPFGVLCEQVGVGEPTLRDILAALERPGRDPREDVPAPLLRTDVLRLDELQVGTVLTGTVRNVVDFGAFVDVGLKNDGLVHISQLSNRFVKHPMDVVSVGDVVTVRVIQVDAQKQRLGLSMKEV